MPVFHHWIFLASFAATIAFGLVASASEPLKPADRDFFESRIRPLLVKRCFACHSSKAETIEGGLRLDSRPAWQKGGDSGPAIVAGKPDDSRLMRAVQYVDEDLAMPPDGVLPKSEIELIRQWIARGAPDPRSAVAPATPVGGIDWERGRAHWAFQPPLRPPPPKVRDTTWPRNAVDSFILARLESRRLHPVGPATSEILIRRVTLDLTGLPPTVRDVDAFLADTRPGAWDQLIDRLLASPAYGEKWGRHWLDVVRYADDQLRTEYYYRPLPHAWRYRDWVVGALNADLPYDQFIIHQLAGDLLPAEARLDGAVAVGLLALGMMYQDDGGTPDGVAIAKAETLDDRVDTVTRGFLALTVSCARCHDHKFDPIPTADYYSLAGIFNNTGYVDELVLVKPAQATEFEAIQGRITSLKNQLKAAKTADNKARIASINRSLAETHKAASLKFPRAHSVRDTGSVNMRIALRGNLRKPGPIAPRRFLKALAGDSPPAVHFRKWTPRTGPFHCGPTQPTHRPGHRQPPVATPLRSRSGGNFQQLRVAWRTPDPSPTSRLAGFATCGNRLVDQAGPPRDPTFGDLSSCRHIASGPSRRRPGQPLVVEDVSNQARHRVLAGRNAGCFGFAR